MNQETAPDKPKNVQIGQEAGEPAAKSGFTGFMVKYQNFIMIGVTAVLLLVILLVYRSMSMQKQADYAMGKLGALTDVDKILEEMENLKIDRLPDVAPAYYYALANKYYEKDSFKDAEEWYDKIIKAFPNSRYAEWSKTKLDGMRANIAWLASNKTQKIDELNANAEPVVTLKTDKGELKITLFENAAPNAVASFLSTVMSGAYNGSFVYEITEDMIKLGSKDMEGKTPVVDYKLPYEKSSMSNFMGIVGLVREIDPNAKEGVPEDPKFLDTSDSRFYICLKPSTAIDGKFMIIGRAEGGLLNQTDQPNKKLAVGDKIKEVQVQRKRPHEYKPNVIKK